MLFSQLGQNSPRLSTWALRLLLDHRHPNSTSGFPHVMSPHFLPHVQIGTPCLPDALQVPLETLSFVLSCSALNTCLTPSYLVASDMWDDSYIGHAQASIHFSLLASCHVWCCALIQAQLHPNALWNFLHLLSCYLHFRFWRLVDLQVVHVEAVGEARVPGVHSK